MNDASTDPIHNAWLGRMQTELGVHLTNVLLLQVREEALKTALEKTMAEKALIAERLENMGKTNAALRAELEALRAVKKPAQKPRGKTPTKE